jgi:hypothetical protein
MLSVDESKFWVRLLYVYISDYPHHVLVQTVYKGGGVLRKNLVKLSLYCKNAVA